MIVAKIPMIVQLYWKGEIFLAKQYSAPPEMQIDPKKTYKAIFHTDKGDITVDLFAAQAPATVNNFVFLARDGFYNNTTFHRVIYGPGWRSYWHWYGWSWLQI